MNKKEFLHGFIASPGNTATMPDRAQAERISTSKNIGNNLISSFTLDII